MSDKNLNTENEIKKQPYRIDKLSDFRNWFDYLKYINPALEEIGKSYCNLKDPVNPNLTDVGLTGAPYYVDYMNYYYGMLDRVYAARRKYVLGIWFIFLFEIVYLAKHEKLFTAENLQIQKYEDKSVADKKYKDKITPYKTILNIIKVALVKSIKGNSNISEFVIIGNKILKQVEDVIDKCMYPSILTYFENRFKGEKNDKDFQYDLCFLILKMIWLKDSKFKVLYPREFRNVSKSMFNILKLPKFEDSGFDYDKLIKHLQENCDLYSFVCGQYDFDIRSYCNKNLQIAIKNALPTQKQKDEFQKFIEGENKSKKDIKKEEPIPNLEKQNLKDI